MKTLSMSLIILAIAGFSACNKAEDSGTPGQDPELQALTGIVIAVDLEKIALDGPALITIETNDGKRIIAIPSMGLPLCAGYENIADAFSVSVGDEVSVAGSTDEDGRIVPCESSDHYFRVETTVSDSETGLSFVYRSGPGGYAIRDLELQDSSEHSEYVLGYRLQLKSDAEMGQGMEGTPAISVSVFRNVGLRSASVWVDEHPAISQIDLATGDVDRDEVLGGANAVRYVVDGLYRSRMIVAAHGGFIYIVAGDFDENNAPLGEDFEPFLASIKFIPVQT